METSTDNLSINKRCHSGVIKHCLALGYPPTTNGGRRLAFDVPPVVHLCAAGETTLVLETWKSREPRPPTHKLENRLWTMKTDFASPSVVELTAGLARAGMASLKIRLDDRLTDRSQWGSAVINAGVLFTTMICGKSLYQLPGDTDGFIVRRGSLTDLRVAYPWASECILGGFYSAVAVSTMKSVSPDAYLEDGDEDVIASNRVQWRWLAYALWSKFSSPAVQQIDRATFRLTSTDVSAVEAVLRTGYPNPVEAEGDISRYSRYGVVELPKGTRFQPCGLDGGDDTTVVFLESLRCRSRYDPTIMADHAEVVVPGVGICNVNISGGDVNFVPDTEVSTAVGGNNSRPLEYFKIFLHEVESPSVLTDLLALIGGRMETLWFGNTGFTPLTVDLSALARVCPQLESLTLSDVSVVVSDDSAALRSWELKTLTIDGVVIGLAPCFADPTYRMARGLIDVNVEVPRN